ncbi:MAG: ATP-binding protein [Planctomycetes bacterium]|nr:ATP-binding protein [Planctomycetota bacterium]
MISRLLDLRARLGEGRSAFLFGPRGVGKTTLAREFLSRQGRSRTVDLLNLDTCRRYLTDPGLFRSELEHEIRPGGRLTVLVDEVQKLPSLLDEVHYLIERHKGKVRFLLTGSSARKLKRGGANLLAGRAWNLRLHPLCAREVDLDLHRALRFGTLPSVYLEDPSPAPTLKAYVDTYLKEEVFQEALVRRTESFVRFLDVAGQQNGEPANFSRIARDSGVSVKTAQEYFSILVDTLIAFRIDGWSHSVRKQLRQAPKFYLFDCGILNAVRGELEADLKPASFRYGRLFETFLVGEVARLNDYLDRGCRLFYWRTNTGQEVDLVLSRGSSDRPVAVEIKSRPDPQESDVRGLLAFASENPRAELLCLCRTPHAYSFGKVKVLPWKEGLERIFA